MATSLVSLTPDMSGEVSKKVSLSQKNQRLSASVQRRNSVHRWISENSSCSSVMCLALRRLNIYVYIYISLLMVSLLGSSFAHSASALCAL